jgi:hypothetical protein
MEAVEESKLNYFGEIMVLFDLTCCSIVALAKVVMELTPAMGAE